MVAEPYGREFDMIFYYKAAQNLVTEHNERDFDMILYFKVAQNLVAEHYERDFDIIFDLKKFNMKGKRTDWLDWSTYGNEQNRYKLGDANSVLEFHQ